MPKLEERLLDQVMIVLVEPSHPGNVGATARAMKTMGVSQLRLVTDQPIWLEQEAIRRASGAEDILKAARAYPDLQQAVADCHFVVGTSSRERSLSWPVLPVEQAVSQAFARSGSVAVVFGRERSGLTNDELQRCQLHMIIPTNPDYASLNLAAAVQVVCYELRRQWLDLNPDRDQPDNPDELIDQSELEAFLQHLDQALIAIDYLDPQNPRLLRERLRRLFARAELRRSEYQLLRGICRSIQRSTKPT